MVQPTQKTQYARGRQSSLPPITLSSSAQECTICYEILTRLQAARKAPLFRTLKIRRVGQALIVCIGFVRGHHDVVNPEVPMPTSALARKFTGNFTRKSAMALMAGASVAALMSLTPALPALAQKAPDTTAQLGRAPFSFADIVDRVKPSVVSISVTSGGQKMARNSGPGTPPGKRGAPGAPGGAPGGRGGDLMPNLPDDHPLKKFFDELPKDFGGGGGQGGPGGQQPRQSQSQGSGFVISEDGYVVTNNHVIDGGTKITVSFDENSKFPAPIHAPIWRC
jgi:hypothetical protein